jgi:hypothetical protein
MAHLARIEAQHRGRGGCGDEGRRQAGAAVPPRSAGSERDDQPRADVVAERHRAQHVVAGSPRQLRRRERRRNGAAAGVKRADRVGVVRLVGVGRHGIGERRMHGRRHDAGADHHCLGLAAQAVHIAGGEFPGFEA